MGRSVLNNSYIAQLHLYVGESKLTEPAFDLSLVKKGDEENSCLHLLYTQLSLSYLLLHLYDTDTACTLPRGGCNQANTTTESLSSWWWQPQSVSSVKHCSAKDTFAPSALCRVRQCHDDVECSSELPHGRKLSSCLACLRNSSSCYYRDCYSSTRCC